MQNLSLDYTYAALGENAFDIAKRTNICIDDIMNLQNLALDRIHSIEISQDSFIENQINFDDYFEDVIGVSNDLAKDPVTVLIALSENIIPYIKSKPIHGSQKINENILSLEVKLNYELEALILSYGENMQVIEPEELVNSLKNRISKINLLY